MLRVITDVLFTSFFSQLKCFETFSLILNHNENPVFLENLLFWEISDLPNKVHGRQNTESYRLLYTKMGRMKASDQSMPSCTHAETLKEICSYDWAWNHLSIACILWYRQ